MSKPDVAVRKRATLVWEWVPQEQLRLFGLEGTLSEEERERFLAYGRAVAHRAHDLARHAAEQRARSRSRDARR